VYNRSNQRKEKPVVSCDRSTRPTSSKLPVIGVALRLSRLLIRLASRRSSLTVVDQTIVAATTFLTAVFVGRLCSQHELGVYYMAFTIVMLMRGVQLELVSSPYFVYCSRHHGNDVQAYAGSTLLQHLLLSAFGIIGLLMAAASISAYTPSTAIASVIWVLPVALAPILLREFVRQFTFSHFDPVAALVVDIVVAFLQLGGLTLLGLYGVLHVPSVFLVMAASYAVACGGWFLVRHRQFRFVSSRFLTDWRRNWKFGRWTLASYLVGCTTPYLMPWIVTAAHNEEATGLFAACAMLAGVCRTFVTGACHALTPRAVHAFQSGGVRELRHVLRNFICVFALVLGAICLLLSFLGGALVVLIYGTQYAGAGPIITILAFSVLFQAIGATTGNGLWAIERPHANLLADITALTITLGVAACLIVPWGVLGAAVATLAGTATDALVRHMTLARLLEDIRKKEGVRFQDTDA